MNLLPLLRLSGTDTGLSCSAWTPGCAPAIGSSTLLDARQDWKLSHFPSLLLPSVDFFFFFWLKSCRMPTTVPTKACLAVTAARLWRDVDGDASAAERRHQDEWGRDRLRTRRQDRGREGDWQRGSLVSNSRIPRRTQGDGIDTRGDLAPPCDGRGGAGLRNLRVFWGLSMHFCYFTGTKKIQNKKNIMKKHNSWSYSVVIVLF